MNIIKRLARRERSRRKKRSGSVRDNATEPLLTLCNFFVSSDKIIIICEVETREIPIITKRVEELLALRKFRPRVQVFSSLMIDRGCS